MNLSNMNWKHGGFLFFIPYFSGKQLTLKLRNKLEFILCDLLFGEMLLELTDDRKFKVKVYAQANHKITCDESIGKVLYYQLSRSQWSVKINFKKSIFLLKHKARFVHSFVSPQTTVKSKWASSVCISR